MHRDDEEMTWMTPQERKASDALLASLNLDVQPVTPKASRNPNPKRAENPMRKSIGADASVKRFTKRCACGRHPMPATLGEVEPVAILARMLECGEMPTSVVVHDQNDNSMHALAACFVPDAGAKRCDCPEGECKGEDANPIPFAGTVREPAPTEPRHVEDLEAEAERMLGDARGVMFIEYKGEAL